MGEEGGEIVEMRRRSARIWALEEEKEKKKKTKEEEEQKACATQSNHNEMTILIGTVDTLASSAGVPHSEHCEVEEHREEHGLTLTRPPTVRQYDRRRVRKRKRLEDVVVTSQQQVSLSLSLSLRFSHQDTLIIYIILYFPCTSSIYTYANLLFVWLTF
jgi:hypothetical protein